MRKSEIMHPADQICTVMKRIYDRGLTSLTGGNLSVMDEAGVMWVSPSGIDKGNLKREDIVQVFPDGSIKGIHKPTSEYRIHKRIFEVCPGMKAVLHAHSPALVALSIVYQKTDTCLSLASLEASENPGLVEYATPGTLELVDEVGKVFGEGHDDAVLKNHAAFVGSRVDLFHGFERLEQLEMTARLQLNAYTVGIPVLLERPQWEQYCTARAQLPEAQEVAAYSAEEREKRRELALFVKRAYERALFTAMYGTMSVRLSDGTFLISPCTKDNGDMMPQEFVRMDGMKVEYGKIPDKDWRLHEEIYRLHPEVQCIMMAAPAYLTTYAASDAEYPVEIAPESYGVLRKGLKFSFQEFVEVTPVSQILSLENPFAIIRNVGAIAAGPDMTLTFDKMEVAEASAWSLHMAGIAQADIHPLSQEQLLLTD